MTKLLAKLCIFTNIICELYSENEMMRIFSLLDPKNWPNPISDMRENPAAMELRQAFVQWPEHFRMDATTAEADFLKLVDFLETDCFWGENMLASPTDFWTHLLSKWEDMPENLSKVIEATLSVPYGSADAERAFRVMNLVKSSVRTLLKLESVDALMKTAMEDDNIENFNAETKTQEFAKTHHLCD